jgi:cellulose synthase/poly-beta-1,6-N-acetylglucosamine synthase-like glycosyltransferase
MEVSVVVPVLNEAHSVGALIRSLLSQTRHPAEIVIADGGSTDGTRSILDDLAAAHPEIRVVDGPGGRSENRNAAIAAATGEVLACTDAGCIPEPTWLERLIEPFDRGAQWVGGFYRPQGPTTGSTSAGVLMTMVREEVDPASYVPSGASQAFRRVVWETVGGFPEGMIAAEDTVFGERARRAGFHAVFVPEALVVWTPPAGMRAMAAKAFLWGKADGRAGVRSTAYRRILVVYGGSALAAVAGGVGAGRWAGPGAGLGVAAVLLVPLTLVVARRIRRKLRWVEGPGKYLYLPLGHLLQVTAQTAGFLVGSSQARSG